MGHGLLPIGTFYFCYVSPSHRWWVAAHPRPLLRKRRARVQELSFAPPV